MLKQANSKKMQKDNYKHLKMESESDDNVLARESQLK